MMFLNLIPQRYMVNLIHFHVLPSSLPAWKYIYKKLLIRNAAQALTDDGTLYGATILAMELCTIASVKN